MACESHSRKKPALVLVLDKSLSLGGMTSVESGVKGRRLTRLWHVMVAGDDVSHAESVVREASEKIEDVRADMAYVALQKILASAYKEVRARIIEDTFLGSFGWTLNEFMKNGNALLPTSEFSHLLAQIQRFDLGCEFLAVGFESEKSSSGKMFHVTNPGVVTPVDFHNFAAIGSGAPNAYAYLARREQDSYFSLEETIYNGIAAKVLAEKALGIGRETSVMIFKRDGYCASLESVDDIRRIWTEEEENVRPNNLQQRVKKLVKLIKF